MDGIPTMVAFMLIMPFALLLIIIIMARRIDKAEKEIVILKTTVETMLKTGYQPTHTEPPKREPKYAAGGPMDTIRTGTEIF